MAAGQARLLSITSRMSDNELRAQIINNNKMRLATQSSQISEAYVTALNEAQMMFTNYDADNNASYQKLTYNALTSYNPYNNQYIVTNASGNVLLSEADAVKYKDANGDVAKFLKSYGLENTTTYWKNLSTHYAAGKDAAGNPFYGIEYKTGMTDDKGNPLYGYINTGDSTTSADAIAKYIQDLYEGNIDEIYTNATGDTVKLHPGYMEAVSSNDYYDYHLALAKFETAYDEYLGTIASNMSNYLENKIKATYINNDADIDHRNQTLDNIKSGLDGADLVDSASGWLNCLSNFISLAEKLALNDNAKNYFASLTNLLNANQGTTMTETVSHSKTGSMKDGKTVYPDGYHVDNNKLTVYDEDGEMMWNIERQGSPGDYTYKFWSAAGEDDAGNPISEYNQDNITLSDAGFRVNSGTMKDARIKIPNSVFDSSTGDITIETDNTLENMQSIGNSIISSLRTAIYNVWDPTNSEFKPTEGGFGYNEYDAYKAAGSALSTAIFGGDVGEDNYPKLTDIEWIHQVLNGNESINIKEIDNQGNSVPFDPEKTKKDEDFQKIYDAYLLDMIMNTYGEPNYTWVDTSSPSDSYNVNGEAKAQWYENLFERIQSGGYKVLQDGLASSSEWIQFAFESGIITMEQVDSNQNWQPLIYSNCSDITEQTNDAAIAKAEAEYKAAMNKIENKDKRYDLELKNIDTEHNSLQTEYDSIKTAIDKNIERTFKLYS